MKNNRLLKSKAFPNSTTEQCQQMYIRKNSKAA